MTFKTILVHLEHSAQADHLLKLAVRLAGQNESHLIGAYIAHPLEPYVARASEVALSAEIAMTLMKEERRRAAALQRLFEGVTNEQNLIAEWRFDESQARSVTAAILEQAKCVDVLMISAALKNLPDTLTKERITPLISNNSRPTIVVPESYEDRSFGDYVFAAWDGGRESSRAIFEALPVLKNASSVWLHRVNSTDESKLHGDSVTRDLADTLARHGVKLELSRSTCSARKVGEELLSCAKSRGADCIVMGAYGHSRMHDFLLGGATRYVLENSCVPLLMSH